MPLLPLPNECLDNVFTFLNKKALYNCLFVNRYWCRLSVPMVWCNPFSGCFVRLSLINTFLSCLDDGEISSLVPCVIDFNNQTPLFEYGKFVKIINHGGCVQHIMKWLKLNKRYKDDR